MQIFSENYYDKVPELVRVEELIAKISERPSIEKFLRIDQYSNEILEIESIFMKLFNVESCDIIVHTTINKNAIFTIPSIRLMNFSVDKFDMDIITTGRSIKFKNKKGKNLLIHIPSSVFFRFTPSEIVAILLHEIGHSFFKPMNSVSIELADSLMRVYQLGNMIFKVASMESFFVLEKIILIFTNPIVKANLELMGFPFLYNKLKKLKDKTPLKIFFANQIYMDMINNLCMLLTAIQKLISLKDIDLNILKDKFKSSLSMPQLKTTLINVALNYSVELLVRQSYKNELESDRFAARYGYAEDLYNSLRKLSESREEVNLFKNVIAIRGIYKRCYFTLNPLVSHPDIIQRLIGMRDMLNEEYELCKNKAGIRNSIKRDIDKLNKIIEDINKPYDKEKDLLFEKAFNKIYLNWFSSEGKIGNLNYKVSNDLL